LTEYLDRIASGVDARLSGIEPAAMAEVMLLAELHRRICPPAPRQSAEDHYSISRWSGPWRPARQRA
jgi:hypothetical protein